LISAILAEAVGVVLDGGHAPWHLELVALEVDEPVQLLVTSAAVADGDAARVVATAVLLEVLGQRALGSAPGDLLEAAHRHEAAAWAGRLVALDRHDYTPSKSPSIR